MTTEATEPANERPVAVVPNRLAAPFDVDVRSVLRSPAIARAAEVSADWQIFSLRAHLYEAGATTNRVERHRVSEFVGLTAAVGEQLALARSALIECEVWRLRRETQNAIGDEMCHRALTEFLSYYCIGAAHGMVNLAGRLLALDARLHDDLAKRVRTVMAPHAKRSRDWLSANTRTVDALQAIAKTAPMPEMHTVADPIAESLSSTAWQVLLARRDTDFHRWRPQSADVLGLSTKPLWTKLAPDTWRIGGTHDYTDGDGLADDGTRTGSDVLLALTTCATSFSAVRRRVLARLLDGSQRGFHVLNDEDRPTAEG